MRILTGSLLFVVLAAIVGLGWTLDRYFDRLSGSSPTGEIQIYKTMGARLAHVLNTLPSAAKLDDMPTDEALTIAIQRKAEFPLPAQMEDVFVGGEPLVLESDEGISIHFYLSSYDDVLSISPTNYNPSSLASLRLAYTMIFYAGVLALLLLWLTPLIRRLARLRKAAMEFGSGRLDQRINTRGVSYIADIEVEFNRMAERIQSLIGDNKLLSSAMSHDLRTPLARLRFGIDTLEDSRDPDAHKKYVQRLSSDISEMEKLVNSLLEFARLDNVLEGKHPEEIGLSELVRDCVTHQQTDSNMITSDIENGIVVNGNADYCAMLVNNLIQNGKKYAAASIDIRLTRVPGGIELSVCDDGPGIPVSERANVLVPFTRFDSVSQRKGQSQGHGLGLAIVNRIAQWHGASVEIGDADKLKGAKVVVCFPS